MALIYRLIGQTQASLAISLPALSLCIWLAPAAVAADTVRLEDCLAAVADIKTGRYVKVEYLSVTQEGGPTYEFEVLDAQGREWELMCSALSGRVYEIEQEVESAANPLFIELATVDETQARERVLKLYPGTLRAIEYELESNGDPTYEIDVVDASGHQFKVEVSAASGEVIEVHVEEWEIGMEPDEEVQVSE